MFSVYFYGFLIFVDRYNVFQLGLSDGKTDLIIFQKHLLINFLLSG